MSDCFDHAADAYDDLCFGRTSMGDGKSPSGYSNAPRTTFCKYCGAWGLRWGNHTGKWKLYSGDQLHVCKPKNLARGGDERQI